MRLVHASDLHLGFRQFNRMDGTGRNLREIDVTKSFNGFIDRSIEIAPDLMVISGDVMHTVRPSNPVVIESFAGFRRLSEALPRMPIVMVAGNHDAPRSAETGCILQLFRELGVYVIDREALRLTFPDLGLSVLGIPDTPMTKRPALTPDPESRFNVAVIHGEVQGMPGLQYTERAAQAYLRDDLAKWDYVALGHYHVYQEIAPNVFYSGALDYTSSNPWQELAEEKRRGLQGKGFIERDLVTGQHTFHSLPRTRDHIDLAIDATGMGAEELSTALAELLDDAWPDMAIARVVVTGCPAEVSRHVNSKRVREFKARALNLHIAYRRPERRVYETAAAIPSIRSRVSLDDMLTAALKRRQDSGSMAPDLSLEAVTELARGYLRRADELAGTDDQPTPATESVAA